MTERTMQRRRHTSRAASRVNRRVGFTQQLRVGHFFGTEQKPTEQQAEGKHSWRCTASATAVSMDANPHRVDAGRERRRGAWGNGGAREEKACAHHDDFDKDDELCGGGRRTRARHTRTRDDRRRPILRSAARHRTRRACPDHEDHAAGKPLPLRSPALRSHSSPRSL